MTHKCRKCGTCCKYLEFALKKSDVNIEFYIARGLPIYEYEDHIIVSIPHICQHLNNDNTCRVHDDDRMPQACKDWPQWVEGFPEPCIYGKS